MAETTEATNIQRVEVESLETLLGIPGAESITTSAADTKPNFFGRGNKVDTSFIDKPEKDLIPAAVAETPEAKAAALEVARVAKEKEDKIKADLLKDKGTSATELTEVLGELDTLTPEQKLEAEKVAGGGAGRPKVDKDGIIELTKKLIEKGVIVPFEGEKPVDEYTIKDFEELIEANFSDREAKIKEEVPGQFFDSLPQEMQIAAKYIADGGKDIKGMFRALAQVEETRSLDPTKDKDHETIVREYLRATRFGNEEDIQEEITGWKDMNKLAEKAAKFKPKLDTMNEEMIAQKLAQQEKSRKSQEAVAQTFMTSVYDTLKPGELSGMKIDKKTQSLLYNGLVAPNYPSISGRQTNLLGHLLEKYQYVEPNHAIIAEALWLLADPEGYRTKVREVAKTDAAADTARKLKTEQDSKKTGSNGVIQEDTTKTKRTVARTNTNFFART